MFTYLFLLTLVIVLAANIHQISAAPIPTEKLDPELKARLDKGFELLEEYTKSQDNKILEKFLALMEKNFDYADSNKDGFMDLAEFKALNLIILPYINNKTLKSIPVQYRGFAKVMFLDTMKNFDKIAKESFAISDQNKDGKLSKEEFLENAKKNIVESAQEPF